MINKVNKIISCTDEKRHFNTYVYKSKVKEEKNNNLQKFQSVLDNEKERYEKLHNKIY